MKELKEICTYTGAIDSNLMYIHFYNKVPSTFDYKMNESLEIDAESIKFETIKDLFIDVKCYRYFHQIVLKDPSEVDKTIKGATDFEFLGVNKNTDVQNLLVCADEMLIFIESDEITIKYSVEDHPIERIKLLVDDILSRYPKKVMENLEGKVNLIKVYSGDYYTSTEKVKPCKINLEENYNDDFLPINKDIINFLNDRSSGLVLLHGCAGTGKTHYIRNLISNVPKEYIIVPNSIAVRLGDPDLTSFITDHTDSVFILEDCEQLLEDRSENIFNNSINTILNMADGLLSDIVNIKFICTFNAPINKIDPALLRKGRCVAKYEFKELCKEKVQILNEKYNLGHTEIRDMTLAEVYNPDKPNYNDEVKNIKIGF